MTQDSITTRPWFCPVDGDETLYPDTGGRCPTSVHDTYSARRNGCRSGKAWFESRRYDKQRSAGVAAARMMDPTGLVRRIEACHFMGHTGSTLGRALGVGDTTVAMTRRLDNGELLRVSKFRSWAPVLERLAMIPGEDVRTRNWAVKQGFRPLLAWVDIDDPDEQPPTEPRDEPPTLRAVDDLDLDALYVAVRERRQPLGELDARARSYVVERAWRVRLEEGYTTRELLYAVAELLNADPMLVSRTHASAVTRKSRALKEAS